MKWIVVALLLWISPPLDISPEGLIQQLGHERYVKRRQASQLLFEMDSEAIPYLKQHLADDDAEISKECHNLIDKIINVWPDSGKVPQIWSLPTRLRFLEGYEQDIAEQYYKSAWVDEDNDINRIWYIREDVGRYATLKLMADYRLDGAKYTAIQELYREMMDNEKNCFHVVRDCWSYECGNFPPSVLSTEKVKEGDNLFVK